MATQHFTTKSFEEQVLGNDGIVMVDFWADWCGPCKMLGPTMDELAEELDGKALVGKVNIDEQGDIASRFGVMTIPTVIFFKGGEEANRLVGYLPKQRYLDTLASV